MLKAVMFDFGHTIMNEVKGGKLPLASRPVFLMPGLPGILPRVSFERDSPAPGDWVQGLATLLVVFGGGFFYFVWPLMRGRPTPGSCILNYQVVSDFGGGLALRRAVLRTVNGLNAVGRGALMPLNPKKQDPNNFWLDLKFSTHAAIFR
jgi:hypothetical protein